MPFLLLRSLRRLGLIALSLLTLGMTVAQAAPIRILPFGESTTDGGGTESYRKKLGDQLTAAGFAYDFIGSLKRPDPATWDADHQGMSGKANIDLNNWMNANAANYQADIILLWQGTNDCAWGWQYYGPPIDSLSALIDRICEKQPNAQVFVSSIPMMGPNAYPDVRGPGEANAAATAYNNAMPALISAKQAQGKKVHFVDTRGVLQVSDLGGDGIHPLQVGYDKMVPYWFAAIQPFLVPDDSPPTISSSSTAIAPLNSYFSYTIVASGLPTSFSAAGLPAGLSLDTTTGVISGTPTTLGTTAITLGATNANGTGNATLTLTVSNQEILYEQTFTSGTSGWFAYSGDGGVSHTFSSSPNGPGGSQALNLATTVAPSAAYWYAGVGVTIATPVPFTPTTLSSTFLSVDVYAGTSGSPTVTIDVKTPNNDGTLRYLATVTGNTWTTISFPLSATTNSNFDYAAGSYQILVAPAGSGWPNTSSTSRVDNVTLTRALVAPAAPVINSAATATATVNTAFSYTITASGAPTSFSASGLPAGLSFNSTTGVISGTPTAAGISSITLGATNAQGTGNATLTLDVGLPGQVILADPLATNTYFWGLATWANASGSLNFTNEYLSYNSALSPYVATYGPSGRMPWDVAYTPLPSFSPLFAPGNSLSITFEARSSAPNGVAGLTLETASGYDPHNLYTVTTPGLTSTWSAYAFTSVNVIGTPDPARIIALAFTTNGANLGVVEVRNLRIEALAAPPPTGLATFRSAQGLANDGSDDLATPAGDGVANLLKYAFNMLGNAAGQATSLATANSPVLAPSGSAGLPFATFGTGIAAGKLQLTFVRRKASASPAPGLTYTVEFSADLTAPSGGFAANPSATEVAVSLDDTFERVTVTDSVTTPAHRFARVRVTAP